MDYSDRVNSSSELIHENLFTDLIYTHWVPPGANIVISRNFTWLIYFRL
jgi:hypothetical protein